MSASLSPGQILPFFFLPCEQLEPEGADFDLESLGFLVIWLDDSGEVISTQATSKSKDVVNIGGTDVWWPWWAWLIYAGVVVCCICPMLFFFFKWRRDKEAEEEGFGTPGKQTQNEVFFFGCSD